MDEAVRRVFIVGDSLFAETVAQLLGRSGALSVVGTAGDVTGALPLLAECQPDLVIVLSSGERDEFDFCPLLTGYPDLPIVCADLGANDLRIIRSQRLEARTSDLLAAIRSLPSRR
jgi:DNA-binding NarL/FixJ family response regulator